MHRHKDCTTPSRKPPNPAALGWSPFHTAANDYFVAGFLPIPLPLGKKAPPPNGVPNDIVYTRDTVDTWLNKEHQYNIGSIVPAGVVVFDIDDKPGQETLLELENRLGPLPPTWISFRGNPNRYHLWFICPENLSWPGKLGAGLDVIYRHYRYMVVPPSTHPDGGQYRWANMRNNTLRITNTYLPEIDEFSLLPNEWCILANNKGYTPREHAAIDSRLWIKEHGKGKACPEIRRITAYHRHEIMKHADKGGMHDAMINAVWAILNEIVQGHTGGYRALKYIRMIFLNHADSCGRRTSKDALTEWSRACIGAIEKVAIDTVRTGDPCIVEESERGKNPNRFFDPKYGFKSRSLRKAVELTGRLAVGPGKTIYRHTNGLWVPDGEAEIYRRTESLLRQRWRPMHAENVRKVVEHREPLITDDMQDTRYLNLPNGLLDWQEGKLYPHNPNVISTIRIPVSWNEDSECPAIDEFFGEVFPQDAIELAYEILGYMLYNDNPLHKAILLYGSGRNGKGTFIRLARMLVGHNNISAVTPQALDSSQFSSAQLYGKLANLVGDVDPRIFKSTEQFKQLTGGDYMMAQHKHRDPFIFRCRALMVAAFNALPRTADTTEGFFSRWVVVPFTAFFPAGTADPTIIDRLTSQGNLQGLLRYAVSSLQAVMRRGRFALPASVGNATRRFKMEADPVRGFIQQRITFHDVHDATFTRRTEIYNAYTAWAILSGFHQMSTQRFYEAFVMAATDVGKVSLREVIRDGNRGYRGVSIR